MVNQQWKANLLASVWRSINLAVGVSDKEGCKFPVSMNPVPRIGEANMLFPFNQQYNLQLMKMLWHLVSLLPMYYLQIL